MRRVSLRSRRRTLAVTGGAAVLLAVGAGIAIASIPDASGAIHACYKTAHGQARIVESAADCRSSETAIEWNQRGVAGPPGPPGMPGSTISYTNGYSEHVTVPPGSFRFANAICPTGTLLVGGGYATENVSTALLVPTNSYPTGMPDGRGAWYVVMFNIGARAEEFWAVSFCARID
jgi:hypothetical protein